MKEPNQPKETTEQYFERVSLELTGDVEVIIEHLRKLNEDAPPAQEQYLLDAIGHLYLAIAALSRV